MKENYLTQKQIKEKYGISRATLWVWRITGKIKPVFMPQYSPGKRSAMIFYREEDILRLIGKKEAL